MRGKKIISKLLIVIILFQIILPIKESIAADTLTGTVDITAANGRGGIVLKWPGEAGTDRVYKVYQRRDDESSTWQSISTVDYTSSSERVRVLNIYPPSLSAKGTFTTDTEGSYIMDNLKSTYGRGILEMSKVSIVDFNANPYRYLTDTGTSSGNWKYDVIYEGTLDGNNGYDLSEAGYQAILKWVEQGRGYLIGHDCFAIDTTWTDVNAKYEDNRFPVRNRLASYANIQVDEYHGKQAGSGEYVRITKYGLLTNYPYDIGTVGTNLVVPDTHTLGQRAYGDIWMRFNNGANSGDNPNNFYLTTWNNTAMIQTGHSQGDLTEHEQKLTVNTLFYLKQWTTATSTTDHSAQDQRAPNAPQLVGSATQGNQIKLSVNSQDNGSRYSYKINVYNKNDVMNPIKRTNEYTGVVTTGVRGYYYVIDNSPTNDFNINSASYTTGSDILTSKSNNEKYLHVRAIDRAGNLGPVSNYKISVYQLSVNPNKGVWNGSTNTQTFDLGKGQQKAIPVPTRKGYTFKWALAGTGSTMSSLTQASTFTMGTADATLTANWTPITYQVAYHGNGATAGSMANSTHTYDQAKALSPNAYTRSYQVTYNYNGSGQTPTITNVASTFNGWATSSTGNVIYANQASVTNLRDTPGTYNIYAKWTLGSTTMPTARRTGHNFLGWNTNANAQTASNLVGTTYTPQANTTFYAIWEPYSLKVNVNVRDEETKNIIQNESTIGVYEWNKTTGQYNKKMNLTRQEDKTYLTGEYLRYTDENQGKYRIIQETAPTGYYGDWENNNQTNKKVYDFNILTIIEQGQYNGKNVADKGTINIGIENSRTKGKIDVSIIDEETKRVTEQGDATLQGAIYGLYARENIIHADGITNIVYNAGELVKTGTTKDFKTTYEDIELGKYYIKQIKPSKGYNKDETQYNVDITYENERIAIEEESKTVQEKVKKQAFELVKVGTDGGNTELDILKQAGFKVYLIKDLEGVKNGSIKPNEYGIYEGESFKNYDFSNENTALDYTNNTQGENIAEIFTNENGKLQSPELAYGKYIVIESTVPKDHKVITPFCVNIVDDNRTPQRWRLFIDGEIEARVTVEKKDTTSGKNVLNNNAEYRIYNETTGEYVEQWVTYPEAELVGSENNPFKVDEQGRFTTPIMLQPGQYELREIKAPKGYVQTGHEGKSENGIYTEEPKSNVRFKISENSAFRIDPITQESDLLVEQYNERQVGSVTIKAIGDKLTNAGKEEGRYNFEYSKQPIQGAEFEIYAKEDILSPDGEIENTEEKQTKEAKVKTIYKAGEKVTIVKTNEEGKVIIDNLPLGTYYIQQIKPGEGFALNTETKEIELIYEGQEVAVVYREIEYENTRQQTKIEINKKDEETSKALQEAVFGLYVKQDIEYIKQDGKKGIIKADELVETQTTNEEGKAIFNNNLPQGKYYIQEIEAPKGYAKNNAIIDIDATYKKEQMQIAEIKQIVEITNIKTKTKFVVKDNETGNPLEGMELTIRDSSGKVIAKGTTNEQGEIIVEKLIPGEEYTVEQSKIRKGYTENIIIDNNTGDPRELEKTKKEGQKIAFTLEDIAEEQKVTMQNKGKVSDIKIILQGEVLKGIIEDKNGNKNFEYEKQNIAGGKFEIYAKEDIVHPDGKTGVIIKAGTKIAEIDVEKEGTIISKIDENIINEIPEEAREILERGIPEGKYEIKQTKAPEGYYIDTEKSTKEIEIEHENTRDEIEHIEVKFENGRQQVNIGKKKSSIKITKTADKEIYKAKEEAIYTVKVENDGETLLKDIEITEKLINGEFEEKEGITKIENNKVKIDKLEIGQKIELKYKYKIPEEINGKLGNIVVAKATPITESIDKDGNPEEKPEPPIQEEAEKEVIVSDKEMLVIKDSDQNKYLPGETIKYTIKIANATDGEMVNIKITDTMSGIQFEEQEGMKINEDGTVTIEKIEPRGEYNVNYTYIIPEDFKGDKIINNVKVNGTLKITPEDPDNPNNPGKPIEKPIEGEAQKEVEVGKARIKVTKKAEKENYKIGEKAEYEIKIKNDGKIDITNITVEDSLGIGKFKPKTGVEIENGIAKIAKLEAGKTITLYYEYVIPEDKTIGEKIENKVTVKGTGIIENEKDPDNPIKEEIEETAETTIKVQPKDEIGDKDKPTDTDKGKAGIYKYDKETKKAIEGAIFELYTKDDITVNGKIIIAKDTLIERAKSGKDGYARFNADLSIGRYYVKEAKSPIGYIKNDEIIEINAISEGQTQKEIKILREKENTKTILNIIRVEEGKTEQIPGSILKIVDENGKEIAKWTTEKEPKQIKGLETNKKYYIIEEKPAPGYITAEKVEFTLDEYGELQINKDNKLEGAQIQTAIVKSGVTKVQITIIDKYTKEPTTGDTIEVIDKETGKVVLTWTSNGGDLNIEKLPIGKYEIIHKEAGEGYIKGEKIEFEVKDTGEIQKVIIENEITKVEIKVVDETTKEMIKGGKVEIQNEKGEVVGTIENTGEKYYIERLPVGKYTLVQTKAPEGYKKAEILQFEVKETGEIQKIVMENKRLIFDFKVDKWIKAVEINGEDRQGNTIENKEKILKIDIAGSKIKTEEIKIQYKIRISNIGEIEGKVGKIIDEIPEGFKFEASENPKYWKIEGKNIVCTEYENKEIKPKETMDLEVTLRWINSDTNFGIKTNRAKIEGCTNKYGFDDIDQNSNIGEAKIIFSIKTGLEQILLKHGALIVTIELLAIAVLVIIEIKALNKKAERKK